MSHTAVGELWQVEESKIKKIIENGAQKYFDSVSGIVRAFESSDRSIRCIDEGTPGGIHLAGSGILLNLEDAEKVFKAAGATGVYTHEECGAAKLYAKQEGLDPEYADEYCREWVNSLSSNIKVPYKGHISIGEMHRPSGLHTARVAYYDGTGLFDYSALPELPAGFTVSRKYLSADYAQKELEISVSIALGDHGFNNLFSANNPFVIIVLTSSADEVSELMAEAKLVAQGKEKVRVEGVLVTL
ncbi:MAG: hypothetical protein WCT32_01950 [Patescibacteria group bacterium]|jgi:hypothetical protein